jgi:glycyl-tRNA synthetase
VSLSLYTVGGLRFWTEREILLRDQAIGRLRLAVGDALSRLNSAWTYHRVEGPVLTPRKYISPAYDENDIFSVTGCIGDQDAALRAETTASSYLYAVSLLKSGEAKMPTCIWQAGKSFRRETNDGARASELRFNEFYQCEFQCIYRADTKADYRSAVEASVMEEIRRITGSADVRMVDSDRLPDYSKKTRDIEVMYRGKWKEMCSISTRLDFPMESAMVLEVAVGLDRLVCVEGVER